MKSELFDCTFGDVAMRNLKDAYIAKGCLLKLVPIESQSQEFYESRDWVIDGDTQASLDQVRANVVHGCRYEVYSCLVEDQVKMSRVNFEREDLLRFAAAYLSSWVSFTFFRKVSAG